MGVPVGCSVPYSSFFITLSQKDHLYPYGFKYLPCGDNGPCLSSAQTSPLTSRLRPSSLSQAIWRPRKHLKWHIPHEFLILSPPHQICSSPGLSSSQNDTTTCQVVQAKPKSHCWFLPLTHFLYSSNNLLLLPQKYVLTPGVVFKILNNW